MTLIRIFDLIGKPVAGLKADIRSRLADGSLMYPHQQGDGGLKDDYIVTMKAVTRERPKHRGEAGWLYWRWEASPGHNYSGVRLDNRQVMDYHLLIEEAPKA